MYFEILKYQLHGMVQPAVLFVNKDMKVLAKWVQIPTEVSSIFLSFYLNVVLTMFHFVVVMQENFQGAKDRKPFPEIQG